MSRLIDTQQDTAGDIVFVRNDVEIARVDGSGNIVTKGTVNGGSLSAIGDVTIEADTDASGAGDIIIKTHGVERARITAAGVITGFADASKVPTLAELVGGTYAAGTFSANAAIPIFVAPFACNITALNIFCNGGSNVTTSDTNFWTFALRVWRAGTNLGTIASKTTKVTGGEQITVRQDWNFDTTTFDPTLKVLQKGDCIDVAATLTSAPGSFTSPFFQCRYEPA